MNWIINNKVYHDVFEAAEEISDALDTRDYDKWLDGERGKVKIGEVWIGVSDMLKSTDRTAYDCGFMDWVVEQRADIEDKLSNMKVGDIRAMCGMNVIARDDDEDC
jgi:hypothetical protein